MPKSHPKKVENHGTDESKQDLSKIHHYNCDQFDYNFLTCDQSPKDLTFALEKT